MFDNNSLRTIASELGDYCNQTVQEIINPNNRKVKISQLIDALHSEPIASACLNLKCARAVQLLNNKYVSLFRPTLVPIFKSEIFIFFEHFTKNLSSGDILTSTR